VKITVNSSDRCRKANHFTATVVFGSLLAFSACSNAHRPQIEVVTVEQQALEEVEAISPSFFLNRTEDRDAWNRARFFFQTYTYGEPKLTSELFETNRDPQNKYLYRLTRSKTPQGIHYVVVCSSGAGEPTAEAMRNAKNLARFIKHGALEMSLLHR